MTIAALKVLCSRIPWCEPAVLESVLELALEIAARVERAAGLERYSPSPRQRRCSRRPGLGAATFSLSEVGREP